MVEVSAWGVKSVWGVVEDGVGWEGGEDEGEKLQILWMKKCTDSARSAQLERCLPCFLLMRREEPVMPAIRRGVGAVGEMRKAVMVRRSLCPGCR